MSLRYVELSNLLTILLGSCHLMASKGQRTMAEMGS